MSQSSTLEKLEGLKRRIDVAVPAGEVDQAYRAKMQKVAKTVKLDGFRPGKVPMDVVEKRFGRSILIEIAQDLVHSSFVKVVKELDLHVAGQPEVAPDEIKRGQEFKYRIEFEVLPEIQLADLSNISITKPVLKLSEEDINNMITILQQQHQDWKEVDRTAQNKDKVDLDFSGFLEGESMENGSAKNYDLVLGSNAMIPGFEEQLIGVKAGEAREIECVFPADYHKEELKGKKVAFKIQVHKVMEPVLPEITDEFVARIGVEGGIAGLRQEIEKNIQLYLEQFLKGNLKEQVTEQLLALHSFEVPESLIREESQHLQKLLAERKQNISEAALAEQAKKE